jgi:prepilin-type N-terminal cleavage/methylation domain-containing protein
MRLTSSSQGVTVIELITVLAILTIIAAAATPSFEAVVDRYQLRGAANALYSDLLLARMEAIRRGAPVSVSFATDPPSGDWCHALSSNGPCNCLDPGACVLTDSPPRAAYRRDFKRVALSTNFSPARTATFHPARGTANAGTTRLATAVGSVDVVVSSLGRVRMCSLQLDDYPPC